MEKKLTHKEEEVMQILWNLKKAFVNDILEHLPEPKPPYNTISSIVRKLESEGIIGYEAFGKTHRYFPLLSKEDYRKTAFGDFMKNYFSSSPEQMLSYFVKEENVNQQELIELLEKLKETKR